MRNSLILKTGVLLLLTIGFLSPASAKLNSPNCKELKQWGQALYAAYHKDKRPIAPLQNPSRATSLNYVMFEEQTTELFGKPVHDWTSEEMEAAFLDKTRLAKECGPDISSWAAIELTISALIGYSGKRSAAQRTIIESLVQLEGATHSVNLLRLYHALARLPADVEEFKKSSDSAWEAKRAGNKSAVHAATRREDVIAYRDAEKSVYYLPEANERRVGKAIVDSLEFLAPADFSELFGDIGKRLPGVGQGVRMAFEHDLKEIEESLTGFQAFERGVKSFGAEVDPWLDQANREKARVSIVSRRQAISAGIAEGLVRQIDAISPDLNGWRTLDGLEGQIKVRYATAIGEMRLGNLLAKVAAQRVRVQTAVRNDLLGKVNVAPLTPEGKRNLDRLEADMRGQVRAVLGDQGSREVDSSIAEKRSQIAVLEEEANRTEFRASKAIFDDFNSKHKVNIWPDSALLHSNPFMFEGKGVGLVVSFELMLSRESALFDTGRGRSLLVSAMPADWGVGPDRPLMLAMRVTGNQTLEFSGVSGLITSADYVGARVCSERSCAEAFRWTEAADTLGVFEEPAVETKAGGIEAVADAGLRQMAEDLVTRTDPDRRGAEPVDRVQSFPPELKPIVLRGELTVRAMRAFGLLRRNEEELVVSLRARGLDLLGAGYEDMQAWLSSGVAEGIVLSVQDKEGLNGLLRQMESLRAAVAIGG